MSIVRGVERPFEALLRSAPQGEDPEYNPHAEVRPRTCSGGASKHRLRQRFALTASVAAAEQAQIDVEMVGVSGVVIGAQHHVEQVAGTGADVSQEAG